MAIAYLTSSTLIESVQRRAAIPISNNTFTDSDILAFANEEIKMGLVPSILSYNEEYFVHVHDDVSLEASVDSYEIPYRALGGKLRDVFFKDSNGNLSEMTRIPPEHKTYFQEGALNTGFTAYYVQGNDIVLVPSVGTSPTGSLVFVYYMRPNELVDEDRVAEITAINTSGANTIYTVDSVPYSSGTTYLATTDDLDFIQAKPGHRTRGFDINCTAIDTSAKTITFLTANVPDNVEVGDFICFSGETPIPQIPTDLHSVLAERVAARCLEALGDLEGLQAANQKIAELEVKTGQLIDSRVDGSPQKIVNRTGLLRSSRIRRRGWY